MPLEAPVMTTVPPLSGATLVLHAALQLHGEPLRA
ncbi:hypothetical protein JOE48_005956 [Methylobacterium sp. PvR107]|nr:hypothetical protein [Methylobacterium sp. PvR107]